MAKKTRLTGWIIYNGNLPGNRFYNYAKWLKNTAEIFTIDATIYRNDELLSVLTADSFTLIPEQKDFPDFVIFLDKDLYLAQQLEQMNIPVFNSADAIRMSDDKILTYQRLASCRIPFPKTMIAPKVFFHHEKVKTNYVRKVIEQFGFPLIIKEAFGSFGEQVYLIQDEETLMQKVIELHGTPFLFQQFIHSSYGRDLRLQVVGDEVVAAMQREAKDDFRANITRGGKMTPYEPTAEERSLAIQATKAIGADFAGVDLLFHKDRGSLVCEVNSNAHIRNLYECTKIDVAHFMIEHIMKTLPKKGVENS